MSHTPPVPEAARAPYPIQEPPHTQTATLEAATSPATGAGSTMTGPAEAVTALRDAVGPLAGKATEFARARPYATAALLGTIALAVFNTLRGVRSAR